MFFRRRKAHGQEQGRVATAPPSSDEIFGQIKELERANRDFRDPEMERKMLRLRHQAGARLLAEASSSEYPTPDFDSLPEGAGIPEVDRSELTPELLRAAILHSGCLLVRGFVPTTEAITYVEEIERGQAARVAERERRAAEEDSGETSNSPSGSAETSNGAVDPAYYEEFIPDPEFDYPIGREWVSDSDLWAGDSPRLMFQLVEMFERAGLRDVVTGYLGERPALSIEKCTLRKVSPEAGNVWHQDGAFLGDVRALNVWLSLSHCGDEAPGLDIIPRRFDDYVERGTFEFDWAVSNEVAELAAGETGVVRPIFEPGDMLLFDELCLHRTAADPAMPNFRYAVESWFFGPSGFPTEYVPLRF